jgi:hypothetical protein
MGVIRSLTDSVVDVGNSIQINDTPNKTKFSMNSVGIVFSDISTRATQRAVFKFDTALESTCDSMLFNVKGGRFALDARQIGSFISVLQAVMIDTRGALMIDAWRDNRIFSHLKTKAFLHQSKLRNHMV